MAHSVRWVLVALVGAACVGMTLLAARGRRHDVALPPLARGLAALQGFQSTVYDGDRVRVRVSGDSMTVSNTRIVGPFSLGFMHSVVLHNVTVETFPDEQSAAGIVRKASTRVGSAEGDGTTREPSTLAASIRSLRGLLARQRLGLNVVRAEIGPIKVVEHRGGHERVLLTAASCSGGVPSSELVCLDGAMDRNGAESRFREWRYDTTTGAMRTFD